MPTTRTAAPGTAASRTNDQRSATSRKTTDPGTARPASAHGAAWISTGDSAGDSIDDSIDDSVGDSISDSISDSIGDSISDSAANRYLAPDPFSRRIFNPLVAGLTRIGLSVWGSRVLEVRGRSSGEWRAVPVNPLPLGHDRFLVAPRGDTQWVRNLRVAGTGRLRKGRRIECFRATEVADADKTPVLRAYLDKWGFEVGKFFEGITKDSTDAELAAIAPDFPVFRITPDS